LLCLSSSLFPAGYLAARAATVLPGVPSQRGDVLAQRCGSPELLDSDHVLTPVLVRRFPEH
jgi:hypothetical protein